MLAKLIVLIASTLLFSGSGPNTKQISTRSRLQQLPEFEENQIAKARNGARLQLLQLGCELDYGTATVQYHAIKKFEGVGGWFSIKSLSRLLSDEPRYTGPSADTYAAYGSLQFQALQVLPSIVSNPPIPKNQPIRLENTASEARIWSDWLNKNQDSLSRLQPTGDGVVTDEKVCQEVLKGDLSSTAYPPRKKPKKTFGGQSQ